MLDRDNERWLLSFYRSSEITGSLFFGRLARSLRAGPIQHDLSKHYADEAMHAWYWTQCLDVLDLRPVDLHHAYQDQYLEAAGLPANLMEVLAITQVFERRVISQYGRHRRFPGVSEPVQATLTRIMEDEQWHIRWVRDALRGLEDEHGADTVAETVARYEAADREVYARTLAEHEERIAELLS